MNKILLGIVGDGTAGGVDKYILNLYRQVADESTRIDFLTNLPNNPIAENVKKTDSEVFCVKGLSNPFKQYLQVKRLIKQHQYDVVYMNISTAICFPVLFAAKRAGVKKIIAHSHSSGYDCPNKYKRCLITLIHKICKVIVSNSSTHLLTCSSNASKWMFTKGALRKKGVLYIQNTVNTNAFSFDEQKRRSIRQKLNLQDKFVIGNIGNMGYPKNQLFLLDVFNELCKLDKNAHLVIIGDGYLRNSIEEKIHRLNISEKVTLIKKADVSEGYMSAFDIFVLPSVFEGMPIVSVEAQCSSLPCVLSDTIAREAKISNMCEFVSIKSAKVFAKEILRLKDKPRSDFRLLEDLEKFSTEAQRPLLKEVVK